MLVLIAIGFVAGLITSISPCILPVLPVVLAAGVRRQPTEDARQYAYAGDCCLHVRVRLPST